MGKQPQQREWKDSITPNLNFWMKETSEGTVKKGTQWQPDFPKKESNSSSISCCTSTSSSSSSYHSSGHSTGRYGSSGSVVMMY